MPFTGTDFIDVAVRLLNIERRGEPEERSAISRAYYGAFLHCRDYVDAEIEPISNAPGIHSTVRRKILPLSEQIASDLWHLHDRRKEADYDIPYPHSNLAELAVIAVALAREIVAAIDALPRSSRAGDVHST